MATQRVWGGDSEASIDAVNQWMRAQPWYQQFLQEQGQAADGVELSSTQRQALLRLAQANGAVVDEGDIEVDPAGNFNPKGHKLRNTLIAAGIGGAAALTGGAALGAFGGGSAAGSGGLAGLAGAGYTVPSAALSAGGGLSAGGMAGLMGAGSVVPSAALSAGGGIGGAAGATAGAGMAATGGTGVANSTVGPLAGGYSFPASGVPDSLAANSTKSSFWGKILGGSKGEIIRNAVDIAGNLAGNVIQSRQTDKAVQAQIDAANRALELQRNVYLQQRSDLMPYADMGRGAIGDMGRMTGTSPVSAPTRDYFSDAPAGPQTSGVTGPRGASPPHDGNPNNAPVTGQAVPRGSLASLGTSGTVNMLTPDGRPARVPQAQVQAALQAGGRLA